MRKTKDAVKKTRGRNRASRPDDENPELTAASFAEGRAAAEVLPRFIGANASHELLRRGRARLLRSGLRAGVARLSEQQISFVEFLREHAKRFIERFALAFVERSDPTQSKFKLGLAVEHVPG